MNKTPLFIIHNMWWLVPLAVVLIFWEHTAPILLMLVFAYLGRVILNPIISIVEKWGYEYSLGSNNTKLIDTSGYLNPKNPIDYIEKVRPIYMLLKIDTDLFGRIKAPKVVHDSEPDPRIPWSDINLFDSNTYYDHPQIW